MKLFHRETKAIYGIWDALIGEELSCEREGANYADQFAVAIIKDDNIVGHVPRKIQQCARYFSVEEVQFCVV